MSEILFVSNLAKEEQYQPQLKTALEVLVDAFGKPEVTDDPKKATYIIFHIAEESKYRYLQDYVSRGGTKVKLYALIDSFDQFMYFLLKKVIAGHRYTWCWKWSSILGYEVTSKGDRRYSPFYQYITVDGVGRISLEEYYHKFIKPAKENGTYKEGTGHELMKSYLKDRLGLLYELALIGREHPFTDMFDKYGGQNKWYSEILNEILTRNGK